VHGRASRPTSARYLFFRDGDDLRLGTFAPFSRASLRPLERIERGEIDPSLVNATVGNRCRLPVTAYVPLPMVNGTIASVLSQLRAIDPPVLVTSTNSHVSCSRECASVSSFIFVRSTSLSGV